MKRIWLFLLPFTAWAICLTIPQVGPPPTPPPSTNGVESFAASLPIEVLGAPGAIETFSVNVTNGATATELYLQAYNLSYEGKASVEVNGAHWVSITDAAVKYPRLEAANFGIGGPMETLRFTLPVTNAVNGTNTIRFRFNDADGMTIGFRILALNLRNSSGADLIATNAFAYDNPALWVPISTNAADINAGSNAWFYLNIKERGTNIVARCTDCHERAGKDLKYFNFSDKSIIARSIFHSVPAATATNIASYIRSLDVPYETNGRPWNPPYQPGPGMDSKPLRSWAAGMGLEWVQEDGTNALAYIFPGGITTNALNLTNVLNTREIPLALQFPSWNKWLPKFHPFDHNPTFYATNRFTQIYPEIRSNMMSRTGANAANYFRGRASPWDAAGTPAAMAKPNTSDPMYPTWAQFERDRRHWRAVKTWEIMKEWELEEYGTNTTVFAAVPNNAQQNSRRWFHGELFRLGPHVVGTPKSESFNGESAQWYQLQLVLNDGNRRNGSIVPIDWGYQHALNVSAWDNPTNMATYAIMVLNIIKAVEVGYNGIAIGTTHSFNPLKADTYRLQSQFKAPQMNALPAELRAAVIEAVIDPWLDQLEAYSKADMDSRGFTAGLVDRLNNHLDWFPTVGVNSTIMGRIEAQRDKFVGP